MTGTRQFGKAPKDVLKRRDIGAAAKVVLFAMHQESFNTGFVRMSDQALAERSGLCRTEVLKCRLQLEGAGLIVKDGLPLHQVQGYKLLHHQHKGNGEVDQDIVTTAVGEGQKVSCPKCRRKVGAVGKYGLCRSCVADKELPRRVAAARGRLGPAATPDELAAHLKNAKLAARIEGILMTTEEKATA